MEGDVVAAGPGARNKKGQDTRPDVKAGDRVLFSTWSRAEAKIDGEERLIIKASDIMGIVDSTGPMTKAA